MVLGHIIKERRSILNLSIGEVARRMKVTTSTASRWESGEIKKISSENMDLLAIVLETTVDHLNGKDNESNYKPILGCVKAGYDYFSEQNILGYESVSPEDAKCGDYFLRVVGDSMTGSRIYDGDLIYVQQCNDVDSGQIAIVVIDNQEATVKKIKKECDAIVLIATNKKYENRRYTFEELEETSVAIIGRVLQTTVRFD